MRKQCADCVEFYYTCQTWPDGQEFACADFHPLPDVVVNGELGQRVPPSRMGGRTEPRVRRDYQEPDVQEKPRRERRTIAAGPRAVYGDDGIRRCECGTPIPDRKRCCNACRLAKKKAAVHRSRTSSNGTAPDAQEG